MKISIVTVTRNEAKELRHALESVRNQHYADIEHIVVDGQSTDDTVEVVREFPSVRLVSREPAGVYDALNYGMEISTGDIFGFVHGNDAMPAVPVLETVRKVFEEDPDLDFIYGDMRYVRPSTHRHVRIYYAGRFVPRQLLGGMAPPHPTLYMRREVFDRIGPYRLDLPCAADFDMWIRLFGDKSLKSRYIPMIMAEMSTGGRSTAFNARLIYNNIEKLTALHRNGLPANPLRLCQKYLIVLRDFLFGPKYDKR